MATKAVVVLVTWPGGADVQAFARVLREARVAACVSALPQMDSFYRWDGRVERGRERQLLIKTQAARLEALRLLVNDLHPYDTPEFLVLPVIGGDERYLDWIEGAVELGTAPTADS